MIKKTIFLSILMLMLVVVMPNTVLAKEVKTQDELLSALKDGETEITLGNDIELTKLDTTLPSRTKVGVVIQNSVKIDGAGFTITNAMARTTFEIHAGSEEINVEFKNLKMVNSVTEGRCIDTRTGNINLTLDGVSLKTTGSGNLQPLTVGGNAEPETEGGTALTVNVKNSILEAGRAGYAIITYNPVTLNVTKSTLTGYASIYLKGEDGSYGSKGTVATIKDSVLEATANEGESFGAIVFEDNNITLNVVDTEITANTAENSEFSAFKWSALNGDYDYSEDPNGVAVEEISGNKVTVSGTSEIKTSGEGTVVIAKTESENTVVVEVGVKSDLEIPTEYLPEDAVVEKDKDGNLVVVEKEELPPKTGDLKLVLLIGTIVLGIAGSIIISKKKLANNN